MQLAASSCAWAIINSSTKRPNQLSQPNGQRFVSAQEMREMWEIQVKAFRLRKRRVINCTQSVHAPLCFLPHFKWALDPPGWTHSTFDKSVERTMESCCSGSGSGSGSGSASVANTMKWKKNMIWCWVGGEGCPNCCCYYSFPSSTFFYYLLWFTVERLIWFSSGSHARVHKKVHPVGYSTNRSRPRPRLRPRS